MGFGKCVFLWSLECRADQGLTDGLRQVVVARSGQFFLHVKVKIISAVVLEPVPLHPLSDRKFSALLSECWRQIVFVRRWWGLFFLNEVDLLIDMDLLYLIATDSKRFSMRTTKIKWKSSLVCVVTGRRRKLSVLITCVVIPETLCRRAKLHLSPQVRVVEVAVHVNSTSRHFFGIGPNLGESLRFLEEMSLLRWRIVQHKLLFYFLFPSTYNT